jgi:tetratricopeptide (TPR) repeat protein
LERGLARYDKNTPDMDLKHLAADACIVALEQEPMDIAFVSRVWTMVSTAEAFNLVSTSNDPLAVALRHGQKLFDEGKTERAIASLEAILLSVNQDFRPTSTRSALAFELAQWDDVFPTLSARPAVANALWVARARWHASQSLWKEAAADYSRAIAAVPAGDEWFEYAALLWLAEATKEFAAFSRRGVEEFGESCTPFVAYCLARANCLPEKPVVEPEQLLKWAEQAAAEAHNAWYLHALGLAHLRAGHYAEAQRWLEQSRLEPWEGLHVQNVLALAITRARLGDKRLARDTLDEALRQLPRGGMRDLAYGWDWLEMQILRREAESLLSPANDDQP